MKLLYRLFRQFKKQWRTLPLVMMNWVNPKTIRAWGSYQWQFPMKVYYINLAIRRDRKLHMEKQFARYGIRAQRIEAIPTNSEESARAIAHAFQLPISDYIVRSEKWGYVGCYASHRLVLDSIDESSSANTLILEDDLVIFCTAFLSWLDAYQDLAFDILLIDPQGDFKGVEKVCGNLYKGEGSWPNIWGAHAYVVKNSSKQKIMNYLNQRAIDSPDTIFLDTSGELDVYALRASQCHPRGRLGSDITVT